MHKLPFKQSITPPAVF